MTIPADLLASVFISTTLYAEGSKRTVALYSSREKAWEAFWTMRGTISRLGLNDHFAYKVPSLLVRCKTGGEMQFMSIEEPQKIRGLKLQSIIFDECVGE